MAMRLTTVVVEALDVQAQASFWAQALGWQLPEDDPHSEEVAISAGHRDGIGLLFVFSARPKTSKNRLHLDLAAGPGHQDREVQRLLALGASRADIGQGAVPWDVLADPEGNEFCVLPKNNPGERLSAICLDAADPQTQGCFWETATGWQIADRGTWGVRLRSPAGTGPALVMGPPVAPKPGRNRLRMDVVPLLGDDMSVEVSRLLKAGASHVDIEEGEAPQEMLADPEGNEFRVLTPR